MAAVGKKTRGFHAHARRYTNSVLEIASVCPADRCLRPQRLSRHHGAAGTKITIRGAGLVKPFVMVGASPCEVVEAESDSEVVVCTTSPSRGGKAGSVRVVVKAHSLYVAQCREPRTLPCG